MKSILRTFVAAAICAASVASAADARPNLVLILADDLGYETLGANGGTSYRTPELDRLAATGARFTDCYVQPLCTPTRCQIMTGRYNVRNYVRFGMLDRNESTFGALLKQAGYKTCVAGKWQLGGEANLPKRFGFDEACLWQQTRRPPRYANPGLEIDGVETNFSHGEYGPDLVADFAHDFITRNRSKPFFLYYPMILPHGPFQPTPDSNDWNPQLQGERDARSPRHFGDMVRYMDKLVGRLIAHLDKLQLRQKTLVIFVGDNGTDREIRSRMGELEVAGGKGRTTAAGMHVPLIANWPGTIEPLVCRDLVDSTDFLPTLLAAAGVSTPDVDGRSFLPQLLGQAGQPRTWIYSWYRPHPDRDPNAQEMAFNRRFKLYRSGEFFDLESDPQEQHPLHKSELSGDAAQVADELQAALDQYRDARPEALATVSVQ